jgi:hypothetical protein
MVQYSVSLPTVFVRMQTPAISQVFVAGSSGTSLTSEILIWLVGPSSVLSSPTHRFELTKEASVKVN